MDGPKYIDDREYKYVNDKTLSKGSMIFYDGEVYTVDKVITDRISESIITLICHREYPGKSCMSEHIVLNLIVSFN